ncbi:hypothetical protein R3I93_004532 [Phoxinus phoxinus]|uniref:Uncharacterized protein n=1 Tax=Phoxinus phoxinus TaxID=58324 RepID=A0AAN9DFH2_9TELE
MIVHRNSDDETRSIAHRGETHSSSTLRFMDIDSARRTRHHRKRAANAGYSARVTLLLLRSSLRECAARVCVVLRQ